MEDLHAMFDEAPLDDALRCPDTLSDDWITGWQACKECLSHEVAAAYLRGLDARPKPRPARTLAYSLIATCGFVGGFIVAVGAFAS